MQCMSNQIEYSVLGNFSRKMGLGRLESIESLFDLCPAREERFEVYYKALGDDTDITFSLPKSLNLLRLTFCFTNLFSLYQFKNGNENKDNRKEWL